MGRGKIEKKKKTTDDASGSRASFCNRHAGLVKKAHELSVLCEAEVAVVVFSSTGQLYHFASSSVDQVLSRYNKCLEASIAQPEAQKKTPDELAVRKKEVAPLKQRQITLLGNDLTELGLSELQHLEQLLTEGLLSVSERKEQMLLSQIEQSRMKEKQIMLENEQLKKQLEELKSLLPTRAQPVPCFLEYSQEEKSFLETYGASHDKKYLRLEKQIMPENKNLQKQFEELQYVPTRAPRFQEFRQEQTSFPETHDATSHDKNLEKQSEELQSYLPTREQQVSRFLEYSKEKTSFPETHSALGPDAVCNSGDEDVGFFTNLQLGTLSGYQRKRKEPDEETAEMGSFPGTSEH